MDQLLEEEEWWIVGQHWCQYQVIFPFSAVKDPVIYTTYSESSSCSLYWQQFFSLALTVVFQHFCIGKILKTLSFYKGFVILGPCVT